MLQTGGVEFERSGHLQGGEGLMKEAINLHYGICRIQCFWSLIFASAASNVSILCQMCLLCLHLSILLFHCSVLYYSISESALFTKYVVVLLSVLHTVPIEMEIETDIQLKMRTTKLNKDRQKSK